MYGESPSPPYARISDYITPESPETFISAIPSTESTCTSPKFTTGPTRSCALCRWPGVNAIAAIFVMLYGGRSF